MNEFLKTYKLNHEVIEIVNRPIMNKKIESVINNFPKQKSSRPDGLLVNFTKHLENK